MTRVPRKTMLAALLAGTATTAIAADPAAVAAPATPAQAAAPATPAAPAVPESPYDIASKLYEQGRQAEALVQLQKLAEQGDARAQFVVGIDLIEGIHIPRNNALGFAFIVLAAEDTQWGELIAPRAREARAVIEPQLSGADLIHADTLIARYRRP